MGLWNGAVDVMRMAAKMGRPINNDHDLVAACRALRPEWFVEVRRFITLVDDDASVEAALVHCSPVRPWASDDLPAGLSKVTITKWRHARDVWQQSSRVEDATTAESVAASGGGGRRDADDN